MEVVVVMHSCLHVKVTGEALLSEDNSDILWVHEAVQLTVSLVAEAIRGQNGLYL